MQVSEQILDAYDRQYADGISKWREVGAKYKALNIRQVCRDIVAPAHVLEVGAGEGSILHFLEQAEFLNESYALEISNSGLKAIESRGLKTLKEAKQFDGYNIPYQDKTFDLVILSHVLEHVEFPRLLLRELRRVGKFVVIEVPTEFSFEEDQRVQHYLSYGHINIYTPSLLRFLLKTEGFDVIADLMTITSKEVLEYHLYHGRGWKRGWKSTLKIAWRHRRDQLLFSMGNQRQKQLRANAYTVCCRGTDRQIRIME